MPRPTLKLPPKSPEKQATVAGAKTWTKSPGQLKEASGGWTRKKKQPRNGQQQGQQSADWNIFRILLLNHVASAIRRPKWQRTHFNWKQGNATERSCKKKVRKKSKGNSNRWCGTTSRMEMDSGASGRDEWMSGGMRKRLVRRWSLQNGGWVALLQETLAGEVF